MRRRLGLLLAALVLSAPAAAQNTRIISSGTLPATCTAGGIYLKTSGGSEGFYLCLATDTWTGPLVVSDTGITQLTSDVTAGPGSGSQAATIANDAVTNAKAANMAEATIKGRAAGAGAGDPTDLTGTQATAILDDFVGDSGAGGTKGLVPAPASGDAAAGKFLKADGSWTAPAGSGDVVGPGSATDNALVRFDSTTGQLIQDSVVTLSDTGALTLPDNIRQAFNPGANAAGLNVGAVAGDPDTPSDGDLWYDSSANELTARINGANVALGAGGGGGGTEFELLLMPTSNEPPASNPATPDLRNNRPVLDFDAATDESAVFTRVLPAGYGGGGLTLETYWACTSATSGDFRVEAAIERTDASSLDIDADSFASANNAGGACPGTSGQVVKVTIAFTSGAQMDSLAAGEVFRVKVSRDANGDTGTDDAAGDVEYVGGILKES